MVWKCPSPLLFLPLLVTCGDAGYPCVPEAAVVTDIDETLTTSDSEWLLQMIDASHDPQSRPDAAELMRGYDELEYTVYYITARGESIELSDGRTAREATRDWLEDHGFPIADGRLFLAYGTGALGDAAVEYKAGVIEELEAADWTVLWAYGNSDTDIEAFQQAGIPDDNIFLVGERAGEMGVVGIPDEEAFVAHAADHLPTVPMAECD